MNPTLTTGTTIMGDETLHFVGISYGRSEYRIYADREGWFLNGEYTTTPPKGKPGVRIRTALERGGVAFQEFLAGTIQKWELKERAGI